VQEFGRVFGAPNEAISDDHVAAIAKKYHCIIVLKGEEDTVCSSEQCISIAGGNAGMTKGGTGDVLAGLVAALACKNELFLSAAAGSYINKKAGESLYERVGYYFNASDLANEIPKVMKDVQKLS
jgi:NAD(P)H-hydrate epimerase